MLMIPKQYLTGYAVTPRATPSRDSISVTWAAISGLNMKALSIPSLLDQRIYTRLYIKAQFNSIFNLNLKIVEQNYTKKNR